MTTVTVSAPTNVTASKTPCNPCSGEGLVWTRRDNRNVQTKCATCMGEGEL